MNADQLIEKILDLLVYPLIYLLLAIAIIYFIVGIIKYIWGADDEHARSEGKTHIKWGLIGLIIMVCAWGIVKFTASIITEATGEETLLDEAKKD